MSSEVQKKKIENKDNSISNIKNQNTTNVTMNDEDKKQNAFDVSRNKISLQIDEPIPAKKNKFYEFSDKIIKKVHNINYRKIFKKNFCTKTDIIFYITNSLSIIAYYIGLTPCEKDPSECTIKRGMAFYFMVGTFTAISALLYSVYIAFTLYKRKFFFHYLYTLPIFIFFIMEYTGAETADHGFYNAFGFIGVIVIFVPILFFTFVVIRLFKDKKYVYLIFIGIALATVIIIYNNLPGFSCDYWDLGLNNTRIDNDKSKYPCEILHPGKNKCYLRKMDGFFDFSKIFRPSCSAESILKKEKEIFLGQLSNRYFGVSKLNHFGYPITTLSDKYSMYACRDLKDFQELVNSNIIKMDLFNEENYPGEPYPEVEVFFDENNYGMIKINVTRNETLSAERKIIAKNKNSLYNNVLIVYVDALSRNHFQRKIKKLSEFIEPFMLYNLNETEKEYTAFQFMKYNTLKGLTLPNIKAMFYGVGLNETDGVNLVKFYKEQGYVTGHTGTTCGKEIFSVNGLLQSQHLDFNNWDHENIAMFCDENFFDYRYPINKGVASVLKRCLYGKYGFEYMIEYAKQFWKLYPDNKKFFRIHFNEGHEGSMELVTYLADPLFEFVKYFFDNNLLDDTFMFIVSDHGNHMLGPWAILRPQDYLIESTLATLFFIIPNNEKLYKNNLYDIIQKNQQTFITPYDIHDTIVHLAYGTDRPDGFAYSKKGSSLLIDIDPMERYCENPKFNLNIAKSDCKCKKYKS
jgi:hypothetical protein